MSEMYMKAIKNSTTMTNAQDTPTRILLFAVRCAPVFAWMTKPTTISVMAMGINSQLRTDAGPLILSPRYKNPNMTIENIMARARAESPPSLHKPLRHPLLHVSVTFSSIRNDAVEFKQYLTPSACTDGRTEKATTKSIRAARIYFIISWENIEFINYWKAQVEKIRK